jgi:hypothetical protein
VTFCAVLSLRSIGFGSFGIGSSTNANFCRVYQVVNDIGNVLVLELVRGIAVYVRWVEFNIVRIVVDLDRLRRGAGQAAVSGKGQKKTAKLVMENKAGLTGSAEEVRVASSDRCLGDSVAILRLSGRWRSNFEELADCAFGWSRGLEELMVLVSGAGTTISG